ncbi:hypothetical protein QQF64_019501 [Cirrhinus molitorella]|uniref:Uncharacterized protein n=1 Tax=Cirrhinus molitorella TaxID=172907 RepID=A0ABR3LFR9_9TELE
MFVHQHINPRFRRKTNCSSFRFESEAELKKDYISLSLPLEVEYQDNNTYSCVINNPISNQTQHLDISKLCQTCSTLNPDSPSQQDLPLKVLISAAAVGSLLILAVIGIFWICRKHRRADREAQTSEEEITYAETMFYKRKSRKLKVKEEESVDYVPVVMRR